MSRFPAGAGATVETGYFWTPEKDDLKEHTDCAHPKSNFVTSEPDNTCELSGI